MPKYLLSYHGGSTPSSPEEGEKAMADWMAWFTAMGAAGVDGGNPTTVVKTVSAGGVADGGGANPVTGYSVVTAESLDAAVALAKGCPIMSSGSVEVGELVEMMG